MKIHLKLLSSYENKQLLTVVSFRDEAIITIDATFIEVNWCSSDGETTNKNLISTKFIFGKILYHLLVTKPIIVHIRPIKIVQVLSFVRKSDMLPQNTNFK